MTSMTPAEIVQALDQFIVGQKEAKKAVAIALRNRWRRQQLDAAMRDEILPKNILMIGPTGVGKTEIARRLAKLAGAPFLKVEATKFTEVGYVGRDVEQIIRDLVEVGITLAKEEMRSTVSQQAKIQTTEKLIQALVGKEATKETQEKFKKLLEDGALEDKEVEIEVSDQGSVQMPTIDIPGMPGAQMGMMNLGDIFGKSLGAQKKTRRLSIKEARKLLLDEVQEELMDQDKVISQALENVAQNGIVFIDEIDKICGQSSRRGADVSREGVQRDLLPLIEGCTVTTKHGTLKTDHILFVASGAFHVSKPSDLLPELQGRLPNRVELKALTQEDFKDILKNTAFNLPDQYKALLGTEGVILSFSEDALDAIASMTVTINNNVENIGARRLQTVMERLLEELSFDAMSHKGQTITIDRALVEERIQPLVENIDVSKFIL